MKHLVVGRRRVPVSSAWLVPVLLSSVLLVVLSAAAVTAIETRTVIGQAIGIVMERYDLDEDRAFSVLRRISSHENTKLRDVAAQLVATRRLPRSGADGGADHAPSQVADRGRTL